LCRQSSRRKRKRVDSPNATPDPDRRYPGAQDDQGNAQCVLDTLIKALRAASPAADTDEIAKRIAEQVPSMAAAELEAVLDTLYGLYSIRELSGVDQETFLKDFVEGFQKQPDLAVDGKEVPKLRSKFEKLLNIETFNLLSKAKRLQRDGERLYCDTKIISDIRPVFGAKATVRPIGAVVTHTLKLAYHQMGEHREFHVVLDGIDLGLLAEVIHRALLKDETLRSLLKEMRLPDLGV
jgi:hypothetical protein